MRRLATLLLVLFALFSGYWLVVANTVENRSVDALAQLELSGWQVSYDQLETNGYPIRFNTELTEIRLQDAQGTLDYTAPSLKASTNSYWPNSITLDLAPTQRITLGGAAFDITSENLRAMGSVQAALATPLDRAGIEADALSISPTFSDPLRMDRTSLFLTSGETPTQYLLNGTVANLVVPLPATITSPVVFDEVRIVATTELTRPLDRFAGDGMPPRPTAITLTEATIDWGEISALTLTGEADVSDAGLLNGTVTLNVRDWQNLITELINIGAIDEQAALSYAAMARNIAAGADDLSVPITLTDGVATMGFIPLGNIPPLF